VSGGGRGEGGRGRKGREGGERAGGGGARGAGGGAHVRACVRACTRRLTCPLLPNVSRANSWNDCHSRVEVSRQQAPEKICWDFVHALLELAVWLQAGEDRAIAAGSKADKKSGCRPLFVGFHAYCE
jgi:hypothetical protein